eukprot:scaffold14_cov380-Prasinococcus_capsulatus_cf.AAC.15
MVGCTRTFPIVCLLLLLLLLLHGTHPDRGGLRSALFTLHRVIVLACHRGKGVRTRRVPGRCNGRCDRCSHGGVGVRQLAHLGRMTRHGMV